MKKDLIVLGSVTYALKAKEILIKHGISVYIERNKKTREFGCGYAIYIPNNFEKARNILLENNIKIRAELERGE